MNRMKRAARFLCLAILSSLAGSLPLGAETPLGQPSSENREPSPDLRAESVVRQLTDDEKFSRISQLLPVPGPPSASPVAGAAAYYQPIPRLGIPARLETDAGLGVTNRGDARPGDETTALPSMLLTGATFDSALAREAGRGHRTRGPRSWLQRAIGRRREPDPRAARGPGFEYVSEGSAPHRPDRGALGCGYPVGACRLHPQAPRRQCPGGWSGDGKLEPGRGCSTRISFPPRSRLPLKPAVPAPS